MPVLNRMRLFPILLIIIGVSFSLRMGAFIGGFHNIGAAFAQHEEDADKAHAEDKDGEGKKSLLEQLADQEDIPHEDVVNEKIEGIFKQEDEKTPPMPGIFSDMQDGEKIDWQDAGEEDFVASEARDELYKDLAARRKELDARERDIMAREALLRAAEKQLEQKMKELSALKGEIEMLLEKQSEEEKARIVSLVKIYEGMKAQDAARIFNTLDIDVLLMVMSEMSERKTAPILAEMNPERARSITILLAQQKQLPSLPLR